ncbi:ABC transporter substrate-binding protein [Rhodococcus sp. WAY2]|uniref:ABC transporter substrate-binding protein n=1 Tax=Rhodococcus sp. WAY2 TaxID=2663121 RepID=UPI00131FBDC4|nr:iron-siderophore ABC transporter substrate-binding protein [Rhodococcus sp. WAY2]QHE72956.1 Vitamin B12 ABC transporter, B12-binding component [Rhodococcus sp. WAY2]
MSFFSRVLTRRPAAVAAAVVLAATLAACGSPGGGDADSGSGTSAAGGSEAVFPRTVQHHQGETVIEAKPERVVALDNSLVEAVVALDAPLVGGIGSYRDQSGFPEYLGDAVKDTKDVGPLATPDLEAIAALQPDLIVSASVRHEALYDELSAIAPTVFVETTGPIWKQNIRDLGTALGEEDKAAEVLTAYETRAAKLGKAINDKAGNPTVSMVRFVDGPTRLYANKSFSGIVFKDMGLARPADQAVDAFSVEIGEEEIRKADADHIFVTVFSGAEATAESFRRNPLWGGLKGVQANNVHQVEDAIWMTSVSLQGADLMMDDMAEIFGVDPMKP